MGAESVIFCLDFVGDLGWIGQACLNAVEMGRDGLGGSVEYLLGGCQTITEEFEP